MPIAEDGAPTGTVTVGPIEMADDPRVDGLGVGMQSGAGTSPVQQVITDPNFLGLDYRERMKVMNQLDPGFSRLEQGEQRKVVKSFGLHPSDVSGDQPEAESKSVAGYLGLLGTGINESLANFAGMPVDLMNAGLSALGLPMSKEPFGGSESIKGAIQPLLTEEAHTPTERVVKRVGEELGAALPMIGASLKMVKMGVDAPKLFQGIFHDISRVDPAQLARVETALATVAGAGAGVGRETVREIWPEGGPVADFFGELVGSFGATGTLALLRKVQDAPGAIMRFAGFRTEQEIKEEVSGKLDKLVDPERLEQGMEQATKLQEEIPGFQPTLGQTEGGPGVVSAERGFERKQGSKGVREFEERRQQNQSKVNTAVTEKAPEGASGDIAKGVRQGKAKQETLLDQGLSRAQAAQDVAAHRVDDLTAGVLQSTERQMQRADKRAHDRLESLKGTLTETQAGQIIRQEYKAELDAARKVKDELYEDIDPQGLVRVPVARLMEDVARLEKKFNPRVENSTRLPTELLERIKRLGVDHELQMRAEKALADLEAVGGKGKDQRGGFRLPLEQQGKGSTTETIGIPSNYPDWYKSLANEKVAGTENVLDRQTIEAALDTIRHGTPHGLHEKTVEFVRQAIRQDRGFRGSPWYDQGMSAYATEMTESFETITRLRSEILTQIREAAPQNRPLKKALTDLLESTERTIGQLDDRPALAAAFPDAATRFREASKNYAQVAQRLLSGQAEQLGRKDVTGRYRTVDEDAAERFLKNETSMNDFVQALGDRPQAVHALQEALKLDFWKSAGPAQSALIDGARPTINVKAAQNWVLQHQAALDKFSELRDEFKGALNLQKVADDLAKDYQAVAKNPTLRAKLVDPESFLKLDKAEQNMQRVKAVVERTKKQMDKDVASGFLGREADRVAKDVVTSRNPDQDVKAVLKSLRGDEAAIRGFQRAMWDASLQQFQSKATEMFTGSPILQARNMAEFLRKNQSWMTPLFGPERMTRLNAARDAMEMIERTGRMPAPGGSDTALNLESAAKDFGPMWSRVIGVAQGRMGKHWIWLQQISNRVSNHFAGLTETQRAALFEEAFFDPQVAQTLILAERGAGKQLIEKRLRLHLYNMNQLEDQE